METINNNIVKVERRGFASHPENINRAGRPQTPQTRQLQNALRAASRKHNNVEFLHHVANLAYEDKSVALAVLDKLVPDQRLKENEQQVQRPIINIINSYGNTDTNRGLPTNEICIRNLESPSTV